MSSVSRSIDRLAVTFDDESLVSNAGLLVPATLMVRLGLESLVDVTRRLVGRVGGASPGRTCWPLVAPVVSIAVSATLPAVAIVLRFESAMLPASMAFVTPPVLMLNAPLARPRPVLAV